VRSERAAQTFLPTRDLNRLVFYVVVMLVPHALLVLELNRLIHPAEAPG